jgi:hypothetical protein
VYLTHVHVCMYIYIHAMLNKLKPNPMIHLSTLCTWIGELVTKLPYIGFKVHLCTSTSLLIYICCLRVTWIIYHFTAFSF